MTIVASPGVRTFDSEHPRRGRSPQRPRRLTFDTATAVIPILGGSPNLLHLRPRSLGGLPTESCRGTARGIEITHDVDASLNVNLATEEHNLRSLAGQINREVEDWNASLASRIRALLEQQRGRADGVREALEALPYPLTERDSVPVVVRLPRLDRRSAPPAEIQPGRSVALAESDFGHVLSVIRRWAHAILDTPSPLPAAVSETSLRDMLLVTLSTHYDDAAGEVFSKRGKTDIRVIVQTADADGTGKVVFKAECKLWSGPADASKAFVQLTEGYLTERDTRSALVFFAHNTGLSADEISAKVVSQLSAEHGCSSQPGIGGWPVLRCPHPEDSAQHLDIAVVVVAIPRPAEEAKPSRSPKGKSPKTSQPRTRRSASGSNTTPVDSP